MSSAEILQIPDKGIILGENMNSKSNEFEEHVKAWVKLDTSIRELNSRSKALRDSRSELEGKITSFVETHMSSHFGLARSMQFELATFK